MDLGKVAEYYGEKIEEFGPSPEGVDWNGGFSQRLRFKQLMKIALKYRFSVNDLGCGYGALNDYLQTMYDFYPLYTGVDVSEAMIRVASEKCDGGFYSVGDRFDKPANYTVSSGIFNVRLETSDSEWKNHIFETLDHMNEMSTDGFAFNCLTSYSDIDKKKQYLYYAHPCELFDYCKSKYSRNVALLHDYGLYEFTILVRKARHVDLRNG